MTTSPSDRQTGPGLLVAVAILAVAIAAIWAYGAFKSSDRASAKPDTVQAFDVVWELQNAQWRQAEGLYALKADLVPIRGRGRLSDDLEAVSRTFCRAILSALPRAAPVSRRSQVFRVDVTLSTLGDESARPRYMSGAADGTCFALGRGQSTYPTYPGLAPDWYMARWKAKSEDLSDFTVIFRRTGDQRLSSLDVNLACRAALFDLPDMLGDYREAFTKLRKMRVAALAGADGRWIKFNRSLAWDVDIGPGGCGKANEVSL